MPSGKVNTVADAAFHSAGAHSVRKRPSKTRPRSCRPGRRVRQCHSRIVAVEIGCACVCVCDAGAEVLVESEELFLT